jgi:hypothetical protein
MGAPVENAAGEIGAAVTGDLGISRVIGLLTEIRDQGANRLRPAIAADGMQPLQ